MRIPNPVGYLQEMCVKKGLTLPEYGILKQEGPPHNPTFSMYCQVQEHLKVVSSDTKKKGKELAAREVIMCIKRGELLFFFVLTLVARSGVGQSIFCRIYRSKDSESANRHGPIIFDHFSGRRRAQN